MPALILFLMLPLGACQWLGECRSPGGSAQFNDLSPQQSATGYMLIIQHLQKMGFREVEPKSPGSAWPLDSLFGGKPSGYFKDFIFDEKSNPYVISLQIDMNVAHTSVRYQFGENQRKNMQPLYTTKISAEGCQIVTTANAYIVAQLGESHLVYNGMPKCRGG